MLLVSNYWDREINCTGTEKLTVLYSRGGGGEVLLFEVLKISQSPSKKERTFEEFHYKT